MKHSLFTASPFRSSGYNNAVIPMYRPAMSGRLSQKIEDLPVIRDIIEALGISDIGELTGKLDKIIGRVPLGALRTGFETRRADCMTKSVITKWTCLYDLFQDVKRAVRGENGEAPPTTPPQLPARRPPVDTFPWVPVGIAAGIGTAALLYFVFRKK